MDQGNYIRQLQKTLDDFSDAGYVFEVHGLDPPDTGLHSLTEFRCAAQTIRNALQAQEEGYDGFVIGHFIKEIQQTAGTNLEVVIPAGGLPMLLLAREKSLVVDGVVVLNGIAVVTKYAEMMLKLQELAGQQVSRRAAFSIPSPQVVNEFNQLWSS